MAADITVRAGSPPLVRRLPTFGLSWRILGLVIAAILTAELLLFLPSIGLIWDALGAMTRDGAYYTRVGGESLRLPGAMVWIVVDELPMRIAMYDYSVRVLVLSIIIALFTAALLYLALRWLVIRPLQDL